MRKILFVTQQRRRMIPLAELLKKELGFDYRIVNRFVPSETEPCYIIYCDGLDDNALAVQRFATSARKVLSTIATDVDEDKERELIHAEWDGIFSDPGSFLPLPCMHGGANVTETLPPVAAISDLFGNVDDKKISNGLLMLVDVDNHTELNLAIYLAKNMPDKEIMMVAYRKEGKADGDYVFVLPDNLKFMFISEAADFADCCTIFDHYLHLDAPGRDMELFTAQAHCMKCISFVVSKRHCQRIETIDEILEDMNNPRDQYLTLDSIQAEVLQAREKHVEAIREVLKAPDYDAPQETLTVAIVQSRKEYINTLLNSLNLQKYPFQIDIIDNMDRRKSIGQCFNELADRCKTDWILYVGDDDFLSEDYIRCAMDAYTKRRSMYRDINCMITGAIKFDESGRKELSSRYPTGFWRANFVRKYRFDESLKSQVDTEFFKRIAAIPDNNVILSLDWIVGYYYRQHNDNVSGNKFGKDKCIDER